jgi:hypothetical protein
MSPTPRVVTALLAIVLSAVAIAASAHHGWSGYEEGELITLTGTIEASEYANPHATATLKTAERTWRVILAPTTRMQTRGLTKEMVAPGTEATVQGYVHRGDAGELRAERITVAGKTVELR